MSPETSADSLETFAELTFSKFRTARIFSKLLCSVQVENDLHVTCWSSRSKITTLNMYLHFIVPPLPHTYVFFYCISYLSTCQRSHIGDVSSIRRLGSLYKYTFGNFRLSRALDKQLPALLSKCIVCMGKKPAPLRTQQCCPTFLLEPQYYLLTAEVYFFLQTPPCHPSLPN